MMWLVKVLKLVWKCWVDLMIISCLVCGLMLNLVKYFGENICWWMLLSMMLMFLVCMVIVVFSVLKLFGVRLCWWVLLW